MQPRDVWYCIYLATVHTVYCTEVKKYMSNLKAFFLKIIKFIVFNIAIHISRTLLTGCHI